MGDVQTAVSPLLCKPLGIFKDKKERKGLLIYKAVPSESNTSAKFIETLSKYQDLEIEVNRMWETNCKDQTRSLDRRVDLFYIVSTFKYKTVT